MARADHLRLARARIADPSCWTQGEGARDVDGQKVASRDPAACRWCAAGAFHATLGNPNGAEYETLLDTAFVLFKRDLVDVNDRLGHEAVVQVYDQAIARFEAEARDA